jgi:hypothetical protein
MLVLSMSMKNLRPRLPGQPLPYHRGTDAESVESVDSASTGFTAARNVETMAGDHLYQP